MWEKREKGIVSKCLFSKNVSVNQFLEIGMALSRGNEVLPAAGWCSGLFNLICHLELRVIAPDQGWMSKHDSFPSETGDLYLISAFSSTVSGDTTGVSQLADGLFTLRVLLSEACASLHHGLQFYLLVAKSTKYFQKNCPLSGLLLGCPWNTSVDNHILFLPDHCRETSMLHLPT